jgi:methylenetetrahydrofolate dehydrogenase (NADP+)/methenyltetrahydrofolate cyclohydrolase
MKIDGRQVAELLLEHLKKDVAKTFTDKRPKVVVLSVNPQNEDLNFIETKEKKAKMIGADFELVLFKKTPRFEEFAMKLRQKSEDPSTTAVVIQQPLPPQLTTQTLFNYIPLLKDIEGNKAKTPFSPPIGLAVLTMLKYIYIPNDKEKVESCIVNVEKDGTALKQILKRKKIVVMGKGMTGGKPIGDVLTNARLNYINTNSRISPTSSFYKEADIIITAVGKKVIHPEMLKQGVVLINVGIRKDGDKWRGDYDEDEIKDIASFR